MLTRPTNLLDPRAFDGLSSSGPELCETLLSRPGWRLERIVSHGQTTPEGQWYNQPWDEWVALLSGAATLELIEPTESLTLCAGDVVLIPAHRRHRVAWTDPQRPSVWLALHFAPESAQGGAS